MAELARAPELWIQKGHLARVVSFDAVRGIRDEGILPLEHFLDGGGGPDAVAAAIEMNAAAEIYPALYVRRDGELREHELDPHPVLKFDGDAYRRDVETYLEPFLGKTTAATTV